MKHSLPPGKPRTRTCLCSKRLKRNTPPSRSNFSLRKRPLFPLSSRMMRTNIEWVLLPRTHCEANPGLKSETWATYSRSGGWCLIFDRGIMGLRPTQGDEKRLLFSSYSRWRHRPPLCHLDRSAAHWRDLRSSRGSVFSTERRAVGEISLCMLFLGSVFRQNWVWSGFISQLQAS
jgi:hypothetical protein